MINTKSRFKPFSIKQEPQWMTKIMRTGMSDQPPGALVGLVKSCAEPAKLRRAGNDRYGAPAPKQHIICDLCFTPGSLP